MSKCKQEGCQGHLGKFDSCQDEALWQMSLDGTDETTGDVEWEAHYTLMVLNESVRVSMHEPRQLVTVPAGAYIVSENSQGFVDVSEYDTEALAREDFKRADDAYGAWLEQGDEWR
jgi:hypothetical protein